MAKKKRLTFRERKQGKSWEEREPDENYNAEAVEAEKERLAEWEKELPYPEDFLADWNLLRKEIDSSPQADNDDDTDEPEQKA
jgi:hypothetical protein